MGILLVLRTNVYIKSSKVQKLPEIFQASNNLKSTLFHWTIERFFDNDSSQTLRYHKSLP